MVLTREQQDAELMVTTGNESPMKYWQDAELKNNKTLNSSTGKTQACKYPKAMRENQIHAQNTKNLHKGK